MSQSIATGIASDRRFLRERRGSALHLSVPPRWRQPGIVLLGGAAAAAVGYATSQNPDAAPPHLAVVLRVLIVVDLITAGLYAQTSKTQARMGALLVLAGLYSSIWLLNGSSDPVAFSVGMICSGLAPTVFAYLMLAHPAGRLLSRAEQRFLASAGGALMLSWGLLVLVSVQPPFRTPLLRCVPHCPENALFLGSHATGAVFVLKAVALLSWTAVAIGTPLLMSQRVRSASSPVRRSFIAVQLAAVANAVFWVTFLAAKGAGSELATAFGGAYVGVVLAIPSAILVGLGLERLFMGRALAEFATQLLNRPYSDPQVVMATVLGDPSLVVAYPRPELGTHVNLSGAEVAVPEADSGRAVTWIERDGRPVAAVIYEQNLADQARFVQAAGAVAMMRLEAAQLEADLKASTKQLAASRIRLVEAADAERQRIERDLHDGVQQHLLGMRIKLDLAAEAIKEEPHSGERMIAAIGRQMDDLLAAVRALARGVYPSLLTERGLGEALKSAARRLPLQVSVRVAGMTRYPADVEVAVYFCCLEAIQNIVKHGGPGVEGVVRLWQDEQGLRFQVSDSGRGFDTERVKPGNGLLNMRDRVEAVGGTLTVSSSEGRGTLVRGRVPIAC